MILFFSILENQLVQLLKIDLSDSLQELVKAVADFRSLPDMNMPEKTNV